MAFRYNELGKLVSENPRAAADQLRRLFVQADGNASEVARQLQVDYRTLSRWLARLSDAGLNPRGSGSQPPKRGPRKKRADS